MQANISSGIYIIQIIRFYGSILSKSDITYQFHTTKHQNRQTFLLVHNSEMVFKQIVGKYPFKSYVVQGHFYVVELRSNVTKLNQICYVQEENSRKSKFLITQSFHPPDLKLFTWRNRYWWQSF